MQRAADIDWTLFGDIRRLGITAGASAPEVLVEEIIDAFAERYDGECRDGVRPPTRAIFFPLPRHVAAAKPQMRAE